MLRELKQLNIGSIEQLRLESPPGAKAGEALAPGKVVVTVSPSILETLILFLRDWSSRSPDRHVTLRIQSGESLLEIEYDPATMTPESLQDLLMKLLQDSTSESE